MSQQKDLLREMAVAHNSGARSHQRLVHRGLPTARAGRAISAGRT
jgi:hypothetical protein